MSFFRRSLRPPPLASEDAVGRHLQAIRADFEPDPLFRRRLRGTVVNGFVAAREGHAQPVRTPSGMGRLGRACLYATFALAMTAGGVMAASRGAVPGHPLYPVKLEIEALRLRALPARFHDDLAIYMLSERIDELARLAAAGDWQHAAVLAESIEEGYERLAALGVSDATSDGALASHFEVLTIVAEQLPPRARAALERAVHRAPGLTRSALPMKADAAGGNRVRGPGVSGGAPAPAGVSSDSDTYEMVDEANEAASPGRASPAPTSNRSPTAEPTPDAADGASD